MNFPVAHWGGIFEQSVVEHLQRTFYDILHVYMYTVLNSNLGNKVSNVTEYVIFNP